MTRPWFRVMAAWTTCCGLTICCLAACAVSFASDSHSIPCQGSDKEDPRFIDWHLLDARFPRWDYPNTNRPMQDSYAVNAGARNMFRYSADLDSIGPTEFASLARSRQDERRKLAGNQMRRVLEFRTKLRDYAFRNAASPYERFSAPGNFTDVTECIQALVNANGLDPDDPTQWYDLGFFYHVVGDLLGARNAYDHALALVSDSPGHTSSEFHCRLILDYAWLCKDLGLWDVCLDFSEQALRCGCFPKEAKVLTGLALAGAGDQEAALQAADDVGLLKVVKRYPIVSEDRLVTSTHDTDYAQRWIKAMAYHAKGEDRLADYVLGEPSEDESYPFAQWYWNDAACIAEAVGNLDRHNLYADLAIVHRSFSSSFPSICARSTAAPDSTGQAGGHYYLAYNWHYLAGDLFAYATHLAGLSEMQQDMALSSALRTKALSYLDMCLRNHSHSGRTSALMGRMHYLSGHYGLALSCLAKSLSLRAPGEEVGFDTYLLAGLAAMKSASYDSALVYLQSALQLDVKSSTAWQGLGVSYLNLGDMENGRTAFDKGIEADSTSANAWYNRGILNYNESRWDEAVRDLNVAASLEPGREDILQLLERAMKIRDKRGSEE